MEENKSVKDIFCEKKFSYYTLATKTFKGFGNVLKNIYYVKWCYKIGEDEEMEIEKEQYDILLKALEENCKGGK